MVVPHEHTPESSTNAFKQMMARKKAESVVQENDQVFTERTFGKYSQAEYFAKIEELHGHITPGVVLGGIMVDLALSKLPQCIKYNALLETQKCLPDAVQVLTTCSMGNGRMFYVNTGKFAVSLYDETNGKGIRVFVDSKHLEKFPIMNNWLMRLEKQDEKVVIDDIIAEAHHVIETIPVEVDKKYYEKTPKVEVAMCPLCFEPFTTNLGNRCPFCGGDSPFESYG